MPNKMKIYRVMKENVDFYEAEKHRLPCWNCFVRPNCFNEIAATKRAKYLRYTLYFEEACLDAILAVGLIKFGNSDHIKEIKKLVTPTLFDTAVIYFHSEGSKFIRLGYVMLICLVHRNANYIRQGYDTAYYYLGNLFYSTFKEIDFAIELYSRGIDLTTKDSSIFENRGCCFLEKNDLKNALNDFKKAKEIDGGHIDLDKIIHEIENR